MAEGLTFGSDRFMFLCSFAPPPCRNAVSTVVRAPFANARVRTLVVCALPQTQFPNSHLTSPFGFAPRDTRSLETRLETPARILSYIIYFFESHKQPIASLHRT